MDDLSLSSNSIHKILIFDDLAMTLGDDQRVADLMVFSARKANLSIITISQNIFQNSKFGWEHDTIDWL